MKVRDLIKELEDDGWKMVRMAGDHRQFKHPVKPSLVTVHGHLRDDVPVGTLGNIFRQAQLRGKR